MVIFTKENGFPINMTIKSQKIAPTSENSQCKWKHIATTDGKLIEEFYSQDFSYHRAWSKGFWDGFKQAVKIIGG